MFNYAYRAIDRDGNGVAGTLAAVDEQSLAEKLQTIGYWLVDAKTCKPDEVREVSRVKRADLAELFSNLAVLLDGELGTVAPAPPLDHPCAPCLAHACPELGRVQAAPAHHVV